MSDLCTVCEGPLDDGRPIQYDLDGNGAHMPCLEVVEQDDETGGLMNEELETTRPTASREIDGESKPTVSHDVMAAAVKEIALVPNGKAAFDLNYDLGVFVEMNGLEFREGARLPTLNEWLQIGMDLFSVYDSMQFCVGDWINAGEGLFGEDVYEAFTSSLDRATALAIMTHRDPQTLINWASTARKVPKERRRMRPREDDERRRRLTYEHHYAVAALEPDDQTMWLDKAIENTWSVRELREAIQQAKNPKDDGDLDDDGGGGGGDGLTIAERIERAARLVYKQATPADGGVFIPDEPYAQLGAALGEN